jgi:hypothetical protein
MSEARKTDDPTDPYDPYCKRFWDEIEGLEFQAEFGGYTSAYEYVLDDGTFNRVNGHFACDECYIRIGQPSSPSGWVAE